MKHSPWSLDHFRRARDSHLRHARRAASFARESTGEPRRIWVEHARQHVKAARREHWLLVAQSRCISASLFMRKTAGAHQRTPRKTVGGISRAA